MKELTYAPLNLYDNYAEAARNTPDVALIVDEVLPAFPELGLETTYRDSLLAIEQRAYQLAAFGVASGDRVILYKSSKFDTYLLAVAASYLGAVPVMVSYHLPTSTIEVFIERLERPFIVYDEETAGRVEAVQTDFPYQAIAVKDLLRQAASPVPQHRLPLDTISYMTHTSGTTGIPKLICHSANSMGWRVLWQQTIFQKIDALKLLGCHISPVHSRFNIGVSSAMGLGFPLMPLGNANLDTVKRMVTTYRPYALETHPNHFVQWAALARREPEIFAETKYYHSTFDAINYGTMKAFLDASKALDPIFLQVYGQSECGPMIVRANRLDTIDHTNARNMGVGLGDLTSARIADAEGNVLPVNTDGHIQLHSKGRALTYYKEDERFRANVYGEWWDSGDYGCMNEDGELILKDRQVDLVATVDSNLAIEDYLLDRLPWLSEVVIIRGRDKRPQPIIAVHEGDDMNWDAWYEAIADLPRLNEPILMAYDDIPRTATMKVQRLQLEQSLQA